MKEINRLIDDIARTLGDIRTTINARPKQVEPHMNRHQTNEEQTSNAASIKALS